MPNITDTYKLIMKTPEYISAIKTINQINGGWGFLRTYLPEEGYGFSFDRSNNKKLQEISDKINENYDGHSSCSYACTMRFMQHLIQNESNILDYINATHFK